MMASSCGVRMLLGFRMATKYLVFSSQCQGVGPGVSLGWFVSFVRSLVRWLAGSRVVRLGADALWQDWSGGSHVPHAHRADCSTGCTAVSASPRSHGGPQASGRARFA